MCVTWIRISVEWSMNVALGTLPWYPGQNYLVSIWSLDLLYETSSFNKSIYKSISWIDSNLQNYICRKKKTVHFRKLIRVITYSLIRLSITLISTLTAALLIVDVSRTSSLTIYSTASRKFSPSTSCSVFSFISHPDDLGHKSLTKKYQTRSSMPGVCHLVKPRLRSYWSPWVGQTGRLEGSVAATYSVTAID